MSKVKKITVSNLKAISNQTGTFDGCTVLVTGANNSGKTTFLRSLFDRVRGNKPDQVVKAGEIEGFAEAELTTGERLRWEFSDKLDKGFKEKLTYITEKDIRTSLSVALRERFLPATFDVDQFLQDPPMKQRKTLQDLAGLDFTDVDAKYKVAYDERTAVNRAYDDGKVRFAAVAVPEKVEAVDVSLLLTEKETIKADLNSQYTTNKASNDKARTEWTNSVDKIKNDHRIACDTLREDVRVHNKKVFEDTSDYNKCVSALEVLRVFGYKGDAQQFVKTMGSAIEDERDYNEPEMALLPVEPNYIVELPDRTPLDEIDTRINTANEANRKADAYKVWLDSKGALEQSRLLAEDADKAVQKIDTERMDLIKSAKMPEGFTFTDDGIAYNGLPFTREQLSSSGIYIGALKLASLRLGEIRCLHFDASFLDKNSLAEIEKWAQEQDLQLLIERPDFEGGEIEYQLISHD